MLCWVFVFPIFASQSINSASVIEDTLKGASHCMHYKIVGLCFWLKCTPLGCHVETTLKVDQYLPDAVVSVYTKPTNNPWWFAKTIDDPVFYTIGQAQIKQVTHFTMGFGDAHDN